MGPLSRLKSSSCLGSGESWHDRASLSHTGSSLSPILPLSLFRASSDSVSGRSGTDTGSSRKHRMTARIAEPRKVTRNEIA